MLWGYYQKEPIYKTVLENEYLHIETVSLGASLLTFLDKKDAIDIVLGGKDLANHLAFSPYYLGASVGRNANRIADGQFTLNNKTYQLAKNNGQHSLHGGLVGFNLKNFKILKEDATQVIYQYYSVDGEEGYPGNLRTTITYKLKGNTLFWLVEGISDQDTLFNITNHSYFNLDGSNDILNHTLTLPSKKRGQVDSSGLALEKLINVKNSVFDFTTGQKLSEALLSEDEDILLVKGLDHPYIYEEKGLRAILESDKLKLSISSDYLSCHIYSGNYLPNNIAGKNNKIYRKYDGICFECQYYPNAINYSSFKKPILYQNCKQQHYISYQLERKNYDNK